MPRRARRLEASDYYHVLNRASVRRRLFYTPGDYQAFLNLLAETVERFELPLLAYCVMWNHWHLVVRPQNTAHLGRALHWLTTLHAMRWSHAHPRRGPGPVYQGRYKSFPVPENANLVRACRYVERNAVTARLVGRAEEWRWCSAAQRCENRERPALVPFAFLTHASWLDYVNGPRG